jgi:hypothetical protein
MRFMVIVKANKDSEDGILPTSEQLAAMGRYNDELLKAGVMLGGEGLQSSAKGARVGMKGGKPVVVDGPFSETKELIAGFWIWQVKDKAEAIEWAKKIPFEGDEMVEIRQVFEPSEFEVDDVSREMLEKEKARRAANPEMQAKP